MRIILNKTASPLWNARAPVAACTLRVWLRFRRRTALGGRPQPQDRRMARAPPGFRGGMGFAALSGVLLPAVAALRSVAWPALAWCMLGSAMAGATAHRVWSRPKLKEVS
jgi:hypothetical protein